MLAVDAKAGSHHRATEAIPNLLHCPSGCSSGARNGQLYRPIAVAVRIEVATSGAKLDAHRVTCRSCW